MDTGGSGRGIKRGDIPTSAMVGAIMKVVSTSRQSSIEKVNALRWLNTIRYQYLFCDSHSCLPKVKVYCFVPGDTGDTLLYRSQLPVNVKTETVIE